MFQQPLDIFGKNVHFKINTIAWLIITDNRVLPAMRNDGDFEPVLFTHRRHRKADPVDGDGALHCDVLSQLMRKCYTDPVCIAFRMNGHNGARSVDMALDHVTTKPLAHRKGSL